VAQCPALLAAHVRRGGNADDVAELLPVAGSEFLNPADKADLAFVLR